MHFRAQAFANSLGHLVAPRRLVGDLIGSNIAYDMPGSYSDKLKIAPDELETALNELRRALEKLELVLNINWL